jgi:hypothetical protein
MSSSPYAALRDKVASVARKHNIAYFPLCGGADIDHFPDVGKMVIYLLARVLACSLCFIKYLQKIIPFRVSQQYLQITSIPELDVIGKMCRRLEGLHE